MHCIDIHNLFNFSTNEDNEDSDVVFDDDNDNSSPTKQTPIKSWLRKHLNSSEKSSDGRESVSQSGRESMSQSPPPSRMSQNLPQYIIPLVSDIINYS